MTSKAWLSELISSVRQFSRTRALSGPILSKSSGYLTAIRVCSWSSRCVVSLIPILLCLGCELWLLILLIMIIRAIHLHIGILWAICWCIWRWHTIHIYVVGLINSLVHGWLITLTIIAYLWIRHALVVDSWCGLLITILNPLHAFEIVRTIDGSKTTVHWVLSLTHVVHNPTILLGLLHFYGNLADITPVKNTTSWFVSDGISMLRLILFQILSLALNFCVLIYIVQSMAGRNNDFLFIIFRLINEACWRSKCS